ncbi:MAG: serine/threonine-protein kinase, partial [Planctomycetota bacterium]|nr:serine/threonine-protein kinase [Planctomycetota bacterium]
MSSSEHDAWFDRFADGMKEHEDGRTSVPLEGTDLGRYRLETPLGEGSFAIVFRAQDKELNRTVAVKVLKEFAAIDSTLQKRFFREAQFVARISHPNVVTVHDIGTHENTSYLVMEFVNGPALSSALQNNTLDLKEKVEVIEKVARGLEAAHEEGIVHRDLKPANILMTREGIPKVADFGLAHVKGPETRLTRSGATLGTPAYMAPEQVRGETNAIGPQTDVYALGVVLYEMITGRYAYMGKTPVELYGKIIKEDPEPPRKIKSDIAPDLETICLKAMEKSIHRRYSSAREFADDLVRHKNGEP